MTGKKPITIKCAFGSCGWNNYKKCSCPNIERVFEQGKLAERERILKRLDDADCQCCGDTERIKVELMK